MGIVGVNSTAGREVKFIDPSKTTKSESSWLGYTLCDYMPVHMHSLTHSHIHFFSVHCAALFLSHTLLCAARPVYEKKFVVTV